MPPKAVPEAELIRLAGVAGIMPKPELRGRDIQLAKLNKNSRAAELALMGMQPAGLMAQFEAIDFDYAKAVELYDQIRKSPDSSSAARMAAINKLLGLWRSVAAAHPFVQKELATGGRRGTKQGDDETPAGKWFRENKKVAG